MIKKTLRKHNLSSIRIGDTINKSFLNKWCAIDYGNNGDRENKCTYFIYGDNNTVWGFISSLIVIKLTDKFIITESGYSGEITYLDREEVERGYRY